MSYAYTYKVLLDERNVREQRLRDAIRAVVDEQSKLDHVKDQMANLKPYVDKEIAEATQVEAAKATVKASKKKRK